jgi:RNA recognition motif-containing protein
VGRFSNTLTNQSFRAAFEPYGQLDYAEIVYEPNFNDGPRVSRGYGFVKYTREEDAKKALSELAGKDTFGRNCTIAISKRGMPRPPTPGQYLGPKKRSPVRRRYSSDSSRSHSRRRRRRRDKYSRSRSRSRSGGRHRRRRDRSSSRSRSRSQSPRRR